MTDQDSRGAFLDGALFMVQAIVNMRRKHLDVLVKMDGLESVDLIIGTLGVAIEVLRSNEGRDHDV